jgi:hypothetical protein
MGKKVSLKYDFPTEKHLEAQMNGKWYRVTPVTFRSWNGERQITYYDPEPRTEQYNGPLYFWETNFIVKKPEKTGIQYIHEDQTKAKQRKTEKFKI